MYLMLDNPVAEYVNKDLEAFFKLDGKYRTDEMCMYYVKLLMNFPFFKTSYDELVSGTEDKSELPEYSAFLVSCLKYFKSQKFKRGTCLFNHGDTGDKLYLLVQGECKVLLPKASEEVEADENIFEDYREEDDHQKQLEAAALKTNTYTSRTLTKTSKTQTYRRKPIPWDEAFNNARLILPKDAENRLGQYKDDEDLKFTLKNYQTMSNVTQEDMYTLSFPGKLDKYWRNGVFRFKCVASISKGRCFGELALMSTAARAATIYCSLDAMVLTLNKKDFQKIFASSIKSELEKNAFFETMFPTWDKSLLVTFAYHFKEKKFPRNTIIYQEGEKIRYVYIVKTGEVT
jgi:CRP-like cAMP-binding protein